MSFQPGAVLNTQGFGNRPENVEVPVIESRDPAPSDSNPSLYPIGKRWINTVNGSEWSLVGSTSSSGVTTASWTILGGGGGAIATINSQPPIAGNFNILGTANQINVASVAGASTLSLVGPYTPATYTAHAVLVGEGASSIAAVGPGASGEALMGNTGADPSFTGSPSFSGSVTAATGISSTLGNITAAAGNLVATLGSVSAGTTVTGGTGVTATTGNVVATAGQLVAGGDSAGVVGAISITNTSDATIGAGAGTILMATGNPATNTIWLKIYIGATAYWIPAWTTNAP